MQGLTMEGGALSYELELDVSDLTFAIFQGMFFIITPALFVGAFAERMKFSTMASFFSLWGLLVYCPITGFGWRNHRSRCRRSMGRSGLDFAGGNVVHISSGVSALVACILIEWDLVRNRLHTILITCPVRRCSGLVGLGLMPVVPWLPTMGLRWHCSNSPFSSSWCCWLTLFEWAVTKNRRHWVSGAVAGLSQHACCRICPTNAGTANSSVRYVSLL